MRFTIVTASVIVSDTSEEAEWESGPSRLRKYGMRTGQRHPLLSPEAANAHPDFPAARAMPSNSFIGTAQEVLESLGSLQKATQANELMISTSTYSIENRIKTLELLSAAWESDMPENSEEAQEMEVLEKI